MLLQRPALIYDPMLLLAKFIKSSARQFIISKPVDFSDPGGTQPLADRVRCGDKEWAGY
jgi:hypothetical protein